MVAYRWGADPLCACAVCVGFPVEPTGPIISAVRVNPRMGRVGERDGTVCKKRGECPISNLQARHLVGPARGGEPLGELAQDAPAVAALVSRLLALLARRKLPVGLCEELQAMEEVLCEQQGVNGSVLIVPASQEGAAV